MDSKYDFNLKMDQLKKLIGEEDYKTALKIVDGIDWNRVRNINLLTMAATVYEKNSRLEEAKQILTMALDRAPVGKRILYKLSELSVRTGDIDAAEDYYYEFHKADSTDLNNYLLQYMILKARHAPYEKQIKVLELYCEAADPDERWLYELATVYDYAGEADKCVATCDRIALLFGSSNYSIRALRLKMKYEPLTGEQQNILYPRSYIGDPGVRVNAEDSPANDDAGGDLYSTYGLMDEPDISSVGALSEPPAEEYEAGDEDLENAIRNSDALAAVRYPDEDAVFEEYVRQIDLSARDEHRQAVARRLEARSYDGAPAGYDDEDLSGHDEYADGPGYDESAGEGADSGLYGGGAQEGGAAGGELAYDAGHGAASGETRSGAGFPDTGDEGTQLSFAFDGSEAVGLVEDAPGETEGADEAGAAPGAVTDAAGVNLSGVRAAGAGIGVSSGIGAEYAYGTAMSSAGAPEPSAGLSGASAGSGRLSAGTAGAGAEYAAAESHRPSDASAADRQGTGKNKSYHMIVEAETEDDAFEIAVSELKAVHRERGISNRAVKTSAAKLNESGFTGSVAEKVRGKDLVISGAGSLDRDVLLRLKSFMESDQSGAIVVLIDTPSGLDKLEDKAPELFDICDYVSDSAEEDSGEFYDEDLPDNGHGDAYEDDYDEDYEDEDEDDEYQGGSSRSRGDVKKKYSNVRNVDPSDDKEQMEIDDFAQFCTQYAASIDCSITGKSMLALYERIELMEEEGIPLTRESAVDLIEEAADRAEKPPIGKRISGAFHSKYDKNGLLILKEDDFI